MNNKNKIFSFTALAAILIVFLFWRSRAQSFDSPLTDPIHKSSFVESVYGIGIVAANRTFAFKAGVTSTIESLFVKEGEAVKKGDKLVMLENDLIITAPFDGTVTALPFKSEENVFPQAVVVEVVDLLDRYLIVSLEQRAALRVRKGQTARLSFDGLREETFEGSVDSIYSSADDFLVRVDIAKLPAQILPGMTADTAIGINERHNVLLIPLTAVVDNRVDVQRNGRKIRVEVKTGLRDTVMAEVIAGDIQEGDRLFIRKKVK